MDAMIIFTILFNVKMEIFIILPQNQQLVIAILFQSHPSQKYILGVVNLSDCMQHTLGRSIFLKSWPAFNYLTIFLIDD